jgi:hypothetical protein
MGSGTSSFYATSSPLSHNAATYPSSTGEYFPDPSPSASTWAVSPGYAEPATLQQSSPGPSVDPRFLASSPPSNGPAAFNPGPASAGSTPPLPPPFDTTGLPFAGLDFLHNFTPAGYTGSGNQSIEALWQNIGAGAFNFEPELQFTPNEGSRIDPHNPT